MKDDFYIGWSEGTPGSKKSSRSFFLIFVIIMIVLVALFTMLEKPFADSTFAYGELTEIEGQLLEKPVISVRVKKGDQFEIIPLVGFGKMGPHSALTSLLGKGSFQVKLRGTLIQYKGNKIFELTNGASSILSSTAFTPSKMEGAMGSMMEVSGEIVDPKCFFGVMKPGFGKVHKSCAIRCLSGQIPPILAITNAGDFMDYYFLADKEGEMLKEDLHTLVGRKVKVSGLTFQVDNWKSIWVERVEAGMSATQQVAMTSCE